MGVNTVLTPSILCKQLTLKLNAKFCFNVNPQALGRQVGTYSYSAVWLAGLSWLVGSASALGLSTHPSMPTPHSTGLRGGRTFIEEE